MNLRNKVLVMMSTYNGEKYIKEMINSIFKQKGVDITLLIRDDGSVDNTLKIINCYDNDRIIVMKGNNKGSTKSFLDLIMKAPLNYDYYALCDQDDVWLENKIKNAIEKLNAFPINVPCLYYSGQIITDEKLNIKVNHKLDVKRSHKANFIFNQTAGCTCVFNAKLLDFLKMYYPKNIPGHDNWIFKLCASLGGNVYVDSQGYILYRQHGKNVVGLNNSINGKVQRAKEYMDNKNHIKYARELLNGYNSYIVPEWKEYLVRIIESEKKLKARINLYFRKDIKFNSISLRILFIVMVLFKKL